MHCTYSHTCNNYNNACAWAVIQTFGKLQRRQFPFEADHETEEQVSGYSPEQRHTPGAVPE